ncbi:MAG: energy transducer TonB [Pseudochelatococcus sp.]|jgi:protein TonB|uniref:energy transducer TonB n=1 Tax=Pseudochelatococcus sp. TaxID=2020869 RepID=UPI003D8E0170
MMRHTSHLTRILAVSGVAVILAISAAGMLRAQTPGGTEHASGDFIPPRPYPGDVMKHWPAYPEDARAAGQEGTVLVKLRVTAAGEPVDIAVERTSSFVALDLAAVLAVSRWKFTPATRNGTPVDASVTLPIRFTLAGNASAGEDATSP